MTRKWYATLCHPKMYPHTKFGIPTSKNIGDIDRTRKRDGWTDGRTDGQCDYYMPPKVPLGAKKNGHVTFGGHFGSHIENMKNAYKRLFCKQQ